MKHNYNNVRALEDALKNDWRCFFEIKNPTEEVCTYVINYLFNIISYSTALKFFSLLDVSQQTDKICEISMKYCRETYNYIKENNNKNKLLYLKYHTGASANGSIGIQKGSIEANDDVIEEIVCNQQISDSKFKLEYFKNVTCELYEKILTRLMQDIPGFQHYNVAVITNNPHKIVYVKQTSELCKLAFDCNNDTVFHIRAEFKTNEMITYGNEQLISLMSMYVKDNTCVNFYSKRYGIGYKQFLVLLETFISREKTKDPKHPSYVSASNAKDPKHPSYVSASNKVNIAPLTNKKHLSILDQEQTKENCLEAVTQNGMLLKYVEIKNKTLDICMAAIRNDKDALEYVPDGPIKDVCQQELCNIHLLLGIPQPVVTKTAEQIETGQIQIQVPEPEPEPSKTTEIPETTKIPKTNETIKTTETTETTETTTNTEPTGPIEPIEPIEPTEPIGKKYFVKNYKTGINKIMNRAELNQCLSNIQCTSFIKDHCGKVIGTQAYKKIITYVELD